MKRGIILILFIVLNLTLFSTAGAQSCCSGGVPLSSNIGLPPGSNKTLQFSLAYDYNVLKTLKSETEKLEDRDRERLTSTTIFQSSFAVSDPLSFELFIPYVIQERSVEQPQQTFRTRTRGMGDLAVLVRYNVLPSTVNRSLLILGAGPKFPTGKSNLKQDGIRVNPDLQPGSGAWDGLFFGLYTLSSFIRPTMTLSASGIFSMKGTNNSPNEPRSYRFGNELVAILSLSDQTAIGNFIFNTSLSLKYRTQAQDVINENIVINTGGDWLFLMPGFSWLLNSKWSLNLSGDIPLYARVNGVQLTNTYRINLALFFQFQFKKHGNPFDD